MPETVKSELLSDADRSHKCDGQEKRLSDTAFTSWQKSLHNRNMSLWWVGFSKAEIEEYPVL